MMQTTMEMETNGLPLLHRQVIGIPRQHHTLHQPLHLILSGPPHLHHPRLNPQPDNLKTTQELFRSGSCLV